VIRFSYNEIKLDIQYTVKLEQNKIIPYLLKLLSQNVSIQRKIKIIVILDINFIVASDFYLR
jgi:hypothetical protein